ncbi:unnamed protein product [Oncorhynchus mykiss]|uniref:Rho-GAP domain-containing protein n=1 Tax=Oncorhynchus mykiss TaxID=8022 RepID=A0A060ZZN8_ONCMY|nr:unnamed protein product [Oncorhynchus mykiss]
MHYLWFPPIPRYIPLLPLSNPLQCSLSPPPSSLHPFLYYSFPPLIEKLNLDQSEWEDIHVITGALKLFFRELPEPLVPYGFFTDIVETIKMSDYLDKVDRLKWLVLSMPPPNHDTMRFMFSHLKRYETSPQSSQVPNLLNCSIED